MSVSVRTRFILTGPLVGKTLRLGHLPYHFINGSTVLAGPAEEVAVHAKFLERNWQAYPEGHPALAKKKEAPNGQRDLSTDLKPDGQPPVSGDGEPDGAGAEAGGDANDSSGPTEGEEGDTGTLPSGDGSPEGVTNQKLERAIRALDPEIDEHWTKDGRPTMSAVERMYGSTDITRADVEAAAPGYTRDKAKGDS